MCAVDHRAYSGRADGARQDTTAADTELADAGTGTGDCHRRRERGAHWPPARAAGLCASLGSVQSYSTHRSAPLGTVDASLG